MFQKIRLQRLDVPQPMIGDNMIYIDDIIGARYKQGGRSVIDGFDCYGLAIEVSKRFGHTMPDLEGAIGMHCDFISYENKANKIMKIKEIDYPKTEGDIILFKDRKGFFHHIGIYMGNGRFIHCNKLGVHIEKLEPVNCLIGRVYEWLQ